MQGNLEMNHTLPGCHMEKHQEQKQPPDVRNAYTCKYTLKFNPLVVETVRGYMKGRSTSKFDMLGLTIT